MTKKRAKTFTVVLTALVSISVIFHLLNWKDALLEMSNPVIEIYGIISGVAMLAGLYAYSFDWKIIKTKMQVMLLIANTAIVAAYSLIETLYMNHGLITGMELFTLITLYVFVYLPVFSILNSHRKQVQ